MKYELSDKVVIKPRKLIEEQGNMTDDSDIVCRALDGTDRVVSFLCYDEPGEETCWIRTKDGKELAILESIILGHAFEYGDEIEVSDDEEEWIPAKFYNYKPGHTFKYETPDEYFQFARPIRKPKLEPVPENIKFEHFKFSPNNLGLEINENKTLMWNTNLKDWLVIGNNSRRRIPTYLQPCKAEDLKVGDWFINQDMRKDIVRHYSLVLEMGEQFKVAWIVNGGVSNLCFAIETISPLKVVRGEE